MRNKIAALSPAWRDRIERVRQDAGDPPFRDIGAITTFDEVFLFDRAREDAGDRYYLRQAVDEERVLAGVLVPNATLIMSVTVLGPGLRVRHPGYFVGTA
jgi:hypothetical protein